MVDIRRNNEHPPRECWKALYTNPEEISRHIQDDNGNLMQNAATMQPICKQLEEAFKICDGASSMQLDAGCYQEEVFDVDIGQLVWEQVWKGSFCIQ